MTARQVPEGAGARMHALVEELFPICRSITGDGVRQTLEILGRRMPLAVHEVPTGTQVFDWTVPEEWNIRDAYIATEDGRRVVDFRESTLHVVSYSEPVRATMTLEELRPHLHTLPESPELDPVPHVLLRADVGVLPLAAGPRRAGGRRRTRWRWIPRSSPGRSRTASACSRANGRKRCVLTAHVCHPSLANDNLSGVALLTELGSLLAATSRTLTYRLLLIPGSIGSITWLARNEGNLCRIVAGLVLACVGDPSPLTYKRTRHGTARIDRAAAHVVRRHDDGARILDYEPWGWDERQFNSLGFGLPFGCLSRARDGEFEDYHSSADDLELVTPERLEDALAAVLEILDVLETDRRFRNLAPRGEPQLGKRGLYRSIGRPSPRGRADGDALGPEPVRRRALAARHRREESGCRTTSSGRLRAGCTRQGSSPPSREHPHEVLVTGHHGYIGSVLAPTLRDAGHDVVGLDTYYYRDCDFGSVAELVPPLPLDVRDVVARRARGLRRGRAPRRALERPARRPRPRLDVPDQLRGRRRRSRARRRRPESSASSSRLRAHVRCDAGRRPSRRARAATAADALRGVEGRRRGGAPRARGRRLLARRDAQCATAYGVSPRLRLDIVLNNLVAWAYTTGEIRLQSDGTLVAPARAHP